MVFYHKRRVTNRVYNCTLATREVEEGKCVDTVNKIHPKFPLDEKLQLE